MSAKDLISKEISPIAPHTTIKEALGFMDKLKVNALPLVENNIFCALISRRELTEHPDPNRFVRELTGIPLSIRSDSHLFEALDRITQGETDLLPVICNNNHYLGAITNRSLLNRLSVITNATAPGAVILLEMPPSDYVLSDLARLAEQNNARIINLLTYPEITTGMLQIILKVDQEDATYFLRSLERFNYRIVSHYQHNSLSDEMMKDRLEELLYYIDM
ncbi:MAG: CBS domain-containing protein [Bacteroidales bacterium]